MGKEQQTSSIKWPSMGEVIVKPDVDFVYIMRKDGDFTISPIASRFAREYSLPESDVKQVVLEEYDTFFANLADTLQWAHSYRGNFELHLFDPDKLEREIITKSYDTPVISLDPLMDKGVYSHKVSRGYYLGGRQDFGQVARPGNTSLDTQAENIKDQLNGLPANIAEDDIFSGGSLIASLNELIKRGININKVLVGIQVGKPQKLQEMGIEVTQAVRYETTEGIDIFDKVDLGDPRDFLVGGSGLVVILPSGNFGRIPYIQPFVSPTARAGVPAETEKAFSMKVLKANLDFIRAVDEKFGYQIKLGHMDPHFVVAMHETYGINSNIPMDQILLWAMNSIDTVWDVTKTMGETQKSLEDLSLPSRMVLIDVNGTLIPDDSPDGAIDPKLVVSIQELVHRLENNGVRVGLCSDSPLQQLREYSNMLGMTGPVIAENGSIIFHQGKKVQFKSLNNIDLIKEKIRTLCDETSFKQVEDCVAPEFGGKEFTDDELQWAFGAGRAASITLFGHSQLMKYVADGMYDQGLSIDNSIEYPNSISIHPSDYKAAKGELFSLLAGHGYSVLMIGNSMSDWVDPSTGVITAFVGNSNVPHEIRNRSAYVASSNHAEGVVEILTLLADGYRGIK